MNDRRPTLGTSLRTFLPLLAAAFALARGGVACGGDEPAGSGPPAASDEGGDPGPVGPGDDGSSPSPDAELPPLPSFCQGLVFYVSYDDAYAADVGAGPMRVDGGVVYGPGKYGSAVSFVLGDAGHTTAIYYDRTALPDAGGASDAGQPGDGGPNVHPEAEGTVAYWYRRTAAGSSTTSHVRPMMFNGAVDVGPIVARDGSRFGLWDDLGGEPLLVASLPSLVPFYRDMEGFDHVAAAWRRSNDAGATPLLRLAINGGFGEVVRDGGFDAALADAMPSEAGNLPYRMQSVREFPKEGRAQSLRIGGLPATSPQGLFDDVAVWERALSFEEMGALYRSAVSLKEACRL